MLCYLCMLGYVRMLSCVCMRVNLGMLCYVRYECYVCMYVRYVCSVYLCILR